MALIIQYLRFLLARFKIQSSAFSAGLRGTNLPVLLLQPANLFFEILQFKLRNTKVIDPRDALTTRAVVDLL